MRFIGYIQAVSFIVLPSISVFAADLYVSPGTTNYINQVYRPLVNGTYDSHTDLFGLDITHGQGFFTNRDYCLLLQVRDDSPTNSNSAGLWEIAEVISVSSSFVRLQRYMQTGNEYRCDAFKKAVLYKYDIYDNVSISGTVSCISWDGYVGGIVAFSARSLKIWPNGVIDVSRKGMRPGTNSESIFAENYNMFMQSGSANGQNGQNGEHYFIGTGGSGAPGAGSGGNGGMYAGTGSSRKFGGGGGGGGRPPESGYNPGITTRLYMGGGAATGGGAGGGGGTTGLNCNGGYGGTPYAGGYGWPYSGQSGSLGECGGGIVHITCMSALFQGSSVIASQGGDGGEGGNGGNGQGGSTYDGYGGGGGGGRGGDGAAGGTIYLNAGLYQTNGCTFYLDGGLGGAGGAGGIGGGQPSDIRRGDNGGDGSAGGNGCLGHCEFSQQGSSFYHSVELLTPQLNYRTNSTHVDFDVHYGAGILLDQHLLSTNNGISWFVHNNPVNFANDGTYYWTAKGLDAEFAEHYAAQTNKLIILRTLATINLLSPSAGSVFSNQFSIPLIADYGSCAFARQLSTNAGTSWFDYNPSVPVVFPTTGSWFWTARGLNAAGWSYANRTNSFVISAALTNGYAVFLGTPQNDAVVTNTSPLFSVATFGAFNYWGLSTNDQAFYNTTFPTTAALGKGQHSWTARGTYLVPSMTHVNAATTNSFEVIDPEQQSAVRLMAPEITARRPVGYVFFDVMYVSVASPQLSTNNGATWFEYDPPVFFSNTGMVYWTARGMNASSEWVYANSTNALSLEQFDFIDPVANYVKINGGAQFVNTQNVLLALSATDDHLDTMRIGNDAGFSGAGWWPYSTSTNWTLPSGDGSKTVYAQFRDFAGNVSAVISSNTILDMTPPMFSNIALSRYAAPAGVVTATVWVTDALAGLDYAVAPNVHVATAPGRTAAFVQVSYATGVWRGVTIIQSGDDGIAFVNVLGAADRAGNTMQPRWHATNILVDTTAPTNTSIFINAGATYTSNRTVMLSIHAEDMTAIEMLVDNSVGFPSGVWEAYSTTKQCTLTAGDGVKNVYVKFRDALQNVALPISDSIVLDTTPPSGASVTINGGASYTSNLLVTLALAASDLYLTDMRIANNSAFTGVAWVPFATSSNWVLSAGDGTKTVYAQFRDAAGNVSASAQNSTVYDATRPILLSTVAAPDPTRAGSVTATVVFADAPAGMDTTVSPSVLFTTSGGRSASFTQIDFVADTWRGTATALNGDDGLAVIQVRNAKDRAGNVMLSNDSATVFVIDTQAPTNSQITVNAGNLFTSNRTVNLTIYGEDILAMQMMLANDAAFSGGSWESYATTRQWVLAAGEGLKTVYMKLMDTAGNVASPVTGSITLDTIAPTNAVVLVNGGTPATSNLNVTLTLSAFDVNLADMRIANNAGLAGANWIAFAASTNWLFTGGDGPKTAYAQFRDRAGNVSGTAQGTIIVDTTRPVVASAIGRPDPAKSGIVTVTVVFAETAPGMDHAASPNVYVATAGGHTRNVTELSYTGSVWWGHGYMDEGDDGTAVIHVNSAKDMAGNVMLTNDTAGSIVVDTVAPTNYWMQINEGAAFASNRLVRITNDTVGASMVDVATDLSFSNAFTTNYTAVFRWSLPPVQGTNAVYARYRDMAGNSCQTGSWIILDTILPSAASVLINNGESETTNKLVALTLSANDPYLNRMIVANQQNFSGSQWTNYAASLAWMLPEPVGEIKTVYAKFSDMAGWQSAVASNSIDLVPEPGLVVMLMIAGMIHGCTRWHGIFLRRKR